MERVGPETPLGKVLDWCAKQGATDLHAQAGRRYSYRVEGRLARIAPETFPAPANEDVLQMLREAFSPAIFQRIDKSRETDLSFLCNRVRYRANFSKQQGTHSNPIRKRNLANPQRSFASGVFSSGGGQGLVMRNQFKSRSLRTAKRLA